MKKIMSQINNSKCGCQPRILVVDDNQFNIMVIASLIKEDFGIEVDEALNGAIALKMFKIGFNKKCGCIFRSYQLIFMDIQMPVMDGKESSERILNLI